MSTTKVSDKEFTVLVREIEDARFFKALAEDLAPRCFMPVGSNKNLAVLGCARTGERCNTAKSTSKTALQAIRSGDGLNAENGMDPNIRSPLHDKSEIQPSMLQQNAERN